MSATTRAVCVFLGGIVLAGPSLDAAAGVAGKDRTPRKTTWGPFPDLNPAVIWGGECREPEGEGLAFGGQHQGAADARPHTRLLEGGKWVAIHEELRKQNPLQERCVAIWKLRTGFKNCLGRARYIFFEGRKAADERAWLDEKVNPILKKLSSDLARELQALQTAKGLGAYESGQVKFALEHLRRARPFVASLKGVTDAKQLASMRGAKISMEMASEALGAEPPPRASSPVVYDKKTGLYLVFGGDHFDYLTNDIWVFDPAKRKWQQRHPKSAPQPRTYHLAKAPGDGTVHVSSGLDYVNKTDYLCDPYVYLSRAKWVYDVSANTWKAPAGQKPSAPDSRVYRAGSYAPEYYMEGARPDAAAHEAKLKAIPVNTWVAMKPPRRYQRDRCWGSAATSPDHDLLLQWCGGHSSYGGADVAQYHFATNRWEITGPAELPLGCTYQGGTINYPGGMTFNLRPWMVVHTYKTYTYSAALKRMLLVGRGRTWKSSHDPHAYLYDPLVGDWERRFSKPKEMDTVKQVFDLLVCDTPRGPFTWAPASPFVLDTASLRWRGLKVQGKLPPASVDNCGLAYDSKRNRMLFVRKSYKRSVKFDGQVYALDLKANVVSTLKPANREIPRGTFLREFLYHPKADVFILGRPKGQLVVYDPKGNRWVDIKVSGFAPFGVSTGHVYDAKRDLLWVVDLNAKVWCMRLDLGSAKATGSK